MSYLSQPATSNRKLTALGIAVIVHIFAIYALLTGLASDAYKKIAKATEAVEIKIEKPKEEPPPPPPVKEQEIPVVTPPPDVVVQQTSAPPPITTTTTIARPVAPVAVAPAPPAPVVAPPAPPPPRPSAPAQGARIRGNPQTLITPDDYPDSSLRNEEEGTTGISFDVNEKGRVENCTVASSSGHPKLDDTTCSIATRRFRYEPAKAEGGAAVRQSNVSFRFKWQIPKDR